MSQVIAYTTRVDFKTLLEIECKGMTGFAPVIKDTLEDFQSMINLIPDIEILVIDQPATKADYQFLMDALAARESNIKNILILSNEKSTLKKAKSFPTDSVDQLIGQMKTLLGGDKAETTEGYISIPVDSLIHFKMVPFDLYIKISEGKYLKRIPANEDVDSQTVEGFKAKGVTELHFEKKYNRDFSLMLLNNMINKVESDYTTEEAKSQATFEVFVTTKEIVQSVGLPPKVIQVCESVMDRIASDVTKSKDKFSSYLSGMKTKSNLNFQFQFVELTSFIATQIIDDMNQGPKEEQIKQVVFASFFCDISLKEASQLMFRTEESVKELFPVDKKAVLEHALKSSEVVSKYKGAPANAAQIVKQHHGSMTGVGFPKTLPETLLPMAKCLLASQELAFALLTESESPAPATVDKVLKRFEDTPIYPFLIRFQKSCKANL